MANDQTGNKMQSLAQSMHETVSITPTSQLHERLQILSSWFGSLDAAQSALSHSTIVEIGCGQGDTTITLAGLTSDTKARILAVDPAPLDYGSPLTLGQAQQHISQTSLGETIEWVQAEPLEYLGQLERAPEWVVLAHSLFYLPSENYLRELLMALQLRSGGARTTLLLAEWGMRASTPDAEAHVWAVKAQAQHGIPNGNVRTLFTSESIRGIAEDAGWSMVREGWVVPGEDVDDGTWEVAAARRMEKRGVSGDRKALEEMEAAAEKVKKVRSMDVWTGVFELK